MCECILRRHGFRTGFVSGPHLVQPRERIRLDGRPLVQDKFAAHAQRIYGLLLDTQENGSAMPSFFSFMTTMAFHVFLEERVDVAIVEVGFGGIDDSTNVLRTTNKILMYTCTPEKNVENQFQYLMKIQFKEVYFVPRNIYKGTLSQDEQEEFRQMHQNYIQLWNNSNSKAKVMEFECVDDALNCIKKQNKKPSVLITGSLYLIGAVLSIIDPKSVST